MAMSKTSKRLRCQHLGSIFKGFLQGSAHLSPSVVTVRSDLRCLIPCRNAWKMLSRCWRPSLFDVFLRVLNYCFVFLTCRICCFRFVLVLTLVLKACSKQTYQKHSIRSRFCLRNIKNTKAPAPRQHFMLIFAIHATYHGSPFLRVEVLAP